MDYTILESGYWKVVLAVKDQRYLGRSVVVMHEPKESLGELTEEEWIDLRTIIKVFEDTLKKSFGATMFNWSCLMNNAYQEDDPKPQVHLHVRPRYDKSVEFAGTQFFDHEFGHHYNRDPEQNRELSKEQIEEILKHLRFD